MIVTSRWFPPLLALVQTLRHVAFIAYDYWSAQASERHFDTLTFIQRDLARPLFESYEFCGGYSYYRVGQSAALGLDLPAYLAGILLQSFANMEASCIDALTTPRGQIIVAALIFPLWFLVGMSIRRLAQKRWRQYAKNRSEPALLTLAVFSALFGLLAVVVGSIGLLVDAHSSLPMLCLGLWMLYAAALAAERLRAWPFAKLAATP